MNGTELSDILMTFIFMSKETSLLDEINRLNLQNKKLRIENSHYFLGVSKASIATDIAPDRSKVAPV